MALLATSTVAGCSFKRVPILLLQNRIRLGTAVGLAYQSPPPLYFRIPISCADMWVTSKKEQTIKRVISRFIYLGIAEIQIYTITIVNSCVMVALLTWTSFLFLT